MYSYERLSPLNLNHLITLYKNAFNLDIAFDFLQMKYNTADFGVEYIGFIAFTADRVPAAYYGVFPIICEFSGKKVLCAQSADTMTHKEHRGKGLFVDLAKKTYQLAQEVGIQFIFGFPNQNSYPGFIKKLNWVHKEDLNLYEIKVKTFPLVKIVKKISFLNYLYIPFLKSVLFFYRKSPKVFENSLSVNNENYIIHDDVFFRYKKYFQSYFLFIKGKSVWFKVDGRLWIGDIEFANKFEFYTIINSLKKLAFVIGATEIHFQAHPNTDYDNYLSENVKLKSKHPIGLLDLGSGLDISKIKFLPGDFDTF